MYALLAVVSAVTAIVSFVYFQRTGGTVGLVLAGLFLVSTIVTGGIFFSTKVNKNSDIHITD